MALLEHKDGL